MFFDVSFRAVAIYLNLVSLSTFTKGTSIVGEIISILVFESILNNYRGVGHGFETSF